VSGEPLRAIVDIENPDIGKKNVSHRSVITTDQNHNSASILKQIWRNRRKSPRLRCLIA